MWIDDFYRCYYDKKNTGEDINNNCIPIKNEKIPSKLYKYTRAKYAKKILEDNLIYIPNLNELNDPYESYIFFNRSNFKDVIYNKSIEDLKNSDRRNGRKLRKDNIRKITDGVVEKELDKMIENYKKGLSLICLSKYNFINPMWGNYADKHYGVCIEYDLKNTHDEYFKNLCYPLQYVSKSENENLLKSRNNLVPQDIILYEPILKKSDDWSYEQEWRIVIDKLRPNVQDKIIREKTDDGRVKEFINFIKPSGIYLGLRTEECHEKEILEICHREKINAYKMKIDDSNYNIYPKTLLQFNR
jgi:hypothetical protein